MKQIQITIAIITLGVLCSSGCKTLSPPNWAKSWFPEEEPKLAESKYPRPVRMAVVWSPAMLNTPDKKPTRGFGGRIYFYDAANKAVPVEGQLVVYGYDDNKRAIEGRTPDRKYAFTPEQFTSHYSPTELGASYSVWVPWDEVGGPQMDISLVPIFTAASGQLVVGQSSKNLLPGPMTVNSPTKLEHLTLPPPQFTITSPPGADGVEPASFQTPVAARSDAPHRSNILKETSISLPNSLATQLANADPQTQLAQQTAGTANAAPATGAMPNNFRQQQAPRGNWSRGPWVTPPQSSPTNQPLARFVRPSHPAPSLPGLPPTRGLPLTQPFPGAQPSGLPTSPTQGPQSEYSAAW